jgi:hypothetical protein
MKHKLPNNVISILILANQFFNDIDSLHSNNISCILIFIIDNIIVFVINNILT